LVHDLTDENGKIKVTRKLEGRAAAGRGRKVACFGYWDFKLEVEALDRT
jgi:hypothetical protein